MILLKRTACHVVLCVFANIVLLINMLNISIPLHFHRSVYKTGDFFAGTRYERRCQFNSCDYTDVELQRHLNEVIKKKIGRDLSHAFYDVTNYFFEIDFPDGDDNKARRKHEEKLAKAEKSVKNNAYSIKKGVDEYTKENIIDKETGGFLQNTATRRSVDTQKAEKDAMFDGCFCIITSEFDYDEQQIRKIYGNLWRIG